MGVVEEKILPDGLDELVHLLIIRGIEGRSSRDRILREEFPSRTSVPSCLQLLDVFVREARHLNRADLVAFDGAVESSTSTTDEDPDWEHDVRLRSVPLTVEAESIPLPLREIPHLLAVPFHGCRGTNEHPPNPLGEREWKTRFCLGAWFGKRKRLARRRERMESNGKDRVHTSLSLSLYIFPFLLIVSSLPLPPCLTGIYFSTLLRLSYEML